MEQDLNSSPQQTLDGSSTDAPTAAVCRSNNCSNVEVVLLTDVSVGDGDKSRGSRRCFPVHAPYPDVEVNIEATYVRINAF